VAPENIDERTTVQARSLDPVVRSAEFIAMSFWQNQAQVQI
jgi:hypothetical protein